MMYATIFPTPSPCIMREKEKTSMIREDSGVYMSLDHTFQRDHLIMKKKPCIYFSLPRTNETPSPCPMPKTHARAHTHACARTQRKQPTKQTNRRMPDQYRYPSGEQFLMRTTAGPSEYLERSPAL